MEESDSSISVISLPGNTRFIVCAKHFPLFAAGTPEIVGHQEASAQQIFAQTIGFLVR